MVDVLYILNYLNITYDYDEEAYLKIKDSRFAFWHEKAFENSSLIDLKSWYPEEDWGTLIGRILASKVHSWPT